MEQGAKEERQEILGGMDQYAYYWEQNGWSVVDSLKDLDGRRATSYTDLENSYKSNNGKTLINSSTSMMNSIKAHWLPLDNTKCVINCWNNKPRRRHHDILSIPAWNELTFQVSR